MATKKPNNGKNPYRKSLPTPADKAAAARLRQIWDARPDGQRPTQEEAIDAFGREISQSAISQMRNGHEQPTAEQIQHENRCGVFMPEVAREQCGDEVDKHDDEEDDQAHQQIAKADSHTHKNPSVEMLWLIALVWAFKKP